jgi:uncharacterized membrane-anchored protein
MMRVGVGLVVAALLCFGSVPYAAAQESAADIVRSLTFRQGTVTLGNNLATVRQTPDFRFLDSKDTETFLNKLWGNPPEASRNKLGMLLPNKNPMGADRWAVVITYDDAGYVSDADAEKIDYDELLRDLQEAVREASKQRVANGYEAFELIGWARPPHYDKAAKKLYWARRLRFGGASEDTLNYEIRVLGRQGVLSLNVVGGIGQLEEINRTAPDLLAMVSFNQGNLYSEFNPSTDKVAAYGLAGLIAGGLLTKAGFFKGLLALLLASKKLVFVGGIALLAGAWAAIKRFFGGGQA